MVNSESMRLQYRREHNYEEERENERDLRNKILDYKADGWNVDEISRKLKISKRRVSRLLKEQYNLEKPKNQIKKNMTKEEFRNWAYKAGHISSK